MWFYVKTPGVVRTLEDGSTEKVHSYASRMREMKPLSKVEPSAEMLEDRDKAFTLACRYLGGHDLVEEMVAFDFWKLGFQNEDFKIEMVQVPVFGPPEGLPFSWVGKSLEEGETGESFLERVESSARRIVGKILAWEYVARRSALGIMPQFNPVFEELGIKHEEYMIPLEVLLSLEKKKDATTKNTIVAADAKNRKGGGAPKVLAKKARVDVLEKVSTGSSSDGSSSSAGYGTPDPTRGFAALEPALLAKTPTYAEPSTATPLPSLLVEDSSNAEAPAEEHVALEASAPNLEVDSGEAKSAPIVGGSPL